MVDAVAAVLNSHQPSAVPLVADRFYVADHLHHCLRHLHGVIAGATGICSIVEERLTDDEVVPASPSMISSPSPNADPTVTAASPKRSSLPAPPLIESSPTPPKRCRCRHHRRRHLDARRQTDRHCRFRPRLRHRSPDQKQYRYPGRRTVRHCRHVLQCHRCRFRHGWRLCRVAEQTVFPVPPSIQFLSAPPEVVSRPAPLKTVLFPASPNRRSFPPWPSMLRSVAA